MMANEAFQGPAVAGSAARLAIAVAAAIAVLTFIVPPACSTTWIVDDDWEGADFSTVQDAMGSASDGDTVLVHAGTYHGTVEIRTAVNVIGNETGATRLEADDAAAIEVLSDGVGIARLSASASGTGTAVLSNGFDGLSVGDCVLSSDRWTVDIRNGIGATFHASTFTGGTAGIFSWNVTGITISASAFEGSGLWLTSADGLRVMGSDLTDTYGTAVFANGTGMLVDDCSIIGPNGDGIRVKGDDAVVIDCDIQGPAWSGVSITGSGCRVERCTVSNAGKNGVWLDGDDARIAGVSTSEVSENGIDIRGSRASVEACAAAGSVFGMSLNGSDISVNGSTVRDDLWATGERLSMGGCTFEGARIRLEGSANTTVSGCILRGEGIWAALSADCVVEDVAISDDPGTGVYLDRSDRFSLSRTTVEGSADHGIYLLGSDDCRFEDVTVRGNGGPGVLLADSQRNSIIASTIADNGGSGVVLWYGSDDNVVEGCRIMGNSLYGVRIMMRYSLGSTGNAVLANRFESNGGNGSQGSDECTGNAWNDTYAGNLWSDYGGEDADVDGIGDTPYAIDGGAADELPVVDLSVIDPRPTASIVLIWPSPALVSETVTFTCSATDDRPITRFNWTSDIDGVLFDGDPAAFSTDRLADGTHLIALVACNDWGQASFPATATLVVNFRPEVTITSPADGARVSGTFAVSGTASDVGGDVERVEISVDGGEWVPASGVSAWVAHFDGSGLSVGPHTVAVRAWDGYHMSEEASLDVEVERKERTPGQLVEVPEEPAAWAGAGAVVASVVILSSTGVGYYLLVSLLFPVFTRLRREKVTDQTTRGAIVEYVRRNPGAHFRQIGNGLEMSNGQLGYHLRVLERSGFLRARSDGFHKRFYPHGHRIPEFVLEPAEKRIVAIVGARPGISGKDLAARMRLTPPTISHHIARLKRKGVVTASRGRGIMLTDDYLGVLETEHVPEFEHLGEAEPGPERASK